MVVHEVAVVVENHVVGHESVALDLGMAAAARGREVGRRSRKPVLPQVGHDVFLRVGLVVRGEQVERLTFESLGQTGQVGRDRPTTDSRSPDLDEDDLAPEIGPCDLLAVPVRAEVEVVDRDRPGVDRALARAREGDGGHERGGLDRAHDRP